MNATEEFIKVDVLVTPEDIVNHVPRSTCDCAFSRALFRALRGRFAVEVQMHQIILTDGIGDCIIPVSRGLAAWITLIDQGVPVPPIGRTLEIPAAFFDRSLAA